MSTKTGKSAELAGCGADRETRKLVSCPYKVLVDGKAVDEFYDVRDAVAAGRIAKRKSSFSHVIVSDQPSGRLIVEI